MEFPLSRLESSVETGWSLSICEQLECQVRVHVTQYGFLHTRSEKVFCGVVLGLEELFRIDSDRVPGDVRHLWEQAKSYVQQLVSLLWRQAGFDQPSLYADWNETFSLNNRRALLEIGSEAGKLAVSVLMQGLEQTGEDDRQVLLLMSNLFNNVFTAIGQEWVCVRPGGWCSVCIAGRRRAEGGARGAAVEYA